MALTYHWRRRSRNMTKFAIAVLTAATLMQPAMSAAGDKPTSYVPHPHSNQHVYGAPIQPAIMGRAKTPHHQHAPKKPVSHPTNSDLQ
jgi:hypothetical protein